MNFHYELGSSIPHSSSKCSQNTKKQKQTDEERQQPATGIRVNRKVSHKCSWHQLHSRRDGRSAGSTGTFGSPRSPASRGKDTSSLPCLAADKWLMQLPPKAEAGGLAGALRRVIARTGYLCWLQRRAAGLCQGIQSARQSVIFTVVCEQTRSHAEDLGLAIRK